MSAARLWRRTAAVCGGIVLIGVMLSPAMGIGQAQDAAFATYGSTAESWGLDVRAEQVGFVSGTPIADAYFPHTLASVSSLPHAAADGEFIDPGGAVRVGPNLANFAFTDACSHNFPAPLKAVCVPLVPNYPYIAATTSDASMKRDVDASTTQPFTPEPGITQLSQLSVPGLPTTPGFHVGTSHAHADATPFADATGSVAGTDSKGAAVNLGAVSVGSVTGESIAQQKNGVISAITTTTMKDVNIAVVLHIASVQLNGRVDTSGPGTAKTAEQVTYSGVTVAGVPSTIDKDGVHIGGSNVALSQAQAALDTLNGALAQANAHLVPPRTTSTTKPDGSALAEINGFGLVFVSADKSVTVSVSLGHAEVNGRATPAQPVLGVDVPAAPLTLGDTEGAVTIPGTAGDPGTSASTSHRRAASATIIQTNGRLRFLVLPLVAVVGELSLILLVWQANRIRRRDDDHPEVLLAL